MPYVDLFQSEFTLPRRVCIVAPGPNGRAHYGNIPADGYVIAVSKAVLIPSIRPKLWLMNHANQDWFPSAEAGFHGIRVFGAGIRTARPDLATGRTIYTYDVPEGQLEERVIWPVEGHIRHGGTVSGCALQLAFNFGAREILLCGLDFSGPFYWDGTRNDHPDHGDIWPAVARLNPLIEWLREERGIAIASLSPTRLQVPRWPNDGG